MAEHPGTPEEEADSARRRIEEIESRIRSVRTNISEQAHSAEARKRAAVQKIARKIAKAKARSNSVEWPREWPFGWVQRDIIDISSTFLSGPNKIVLEWKCPGCGDHVTRVIMPKHRARLLRKADGVLNFIRDIRVGKLNQLCNTCWESYK
jgi:hypothetical protein